jgi:hypothetical protein
MSPEWLFIFAGVVALSAAVFVYVAVIWLQKLRETVLTTLTEMAGQHIRNAQRIGESLDRLQKQQDGLARQIDTLTQGELRLQKEISTVSHRLDDAQGENIRTGHTLH